MTITTSEIVQRLFQAEEPDKLKQLGETLLCQISTDLYERNLFHQNYQKLVVQVLFINAVCMVRNPGMLANLKKVVLDSLYASFEAQVLVTSVFRKNFGTMERGQLAPAVQEIVDSG